MIGADGVRAIIATYYGATSDGGDTPTNIKMGNYGQDDFFRYEWADESIIIHRPNKDLLAQGVEQYYEKDITSLGITIATLTSLERYYEIESEVRRIFLNFNGNSDYSRVHLDQIKEIPNSFYFVSEGIISAYMNLSHPNS